MYTVPYKNNKKVGKATAQVTFKGNYAGTKTLTFTIVPKGTALSKTKTGKKKLTLKWKKQARETSGYEFQHSADKNLTKWLAVLFGLHEGKDYDRIRTVAKNLNL